MSEENWWPSKENYDPKLTKEKWLELLKDEKIFNFNSMCMMRRFLDIGGEATCAELADKYGKTYSAYISFSIWLATRIQNRTSCEMPPERDENARLWPILYIGRRVEKNDSHSGTYVWKLRDELKAALEEIDLLHDEKYTLYDFEGKSKMNYWLINPKNEGSGTDLSGESLDKVYMGWNRKDCPNFYDSVNAKDVIIVTELSHPKTKLHYIGIAHNLDEKNQCWTLKYSTKEKNNEIQKIIRENPGDFGGGSSANPWGPTKSIIKLTNNPSELKIKRILSTFFKEKMMKEKIQNYAELLQHNHNLILHGAPGTGKTHLARDIAEVMNAEVGFVQFHPSYDYTDFVEGLRPVNTSNGGQIGFDRKDGVFKKFCERALKESKIDGSDNFSDIWDKLINELNENNYVDVPLLSGKDTMRIELMNMEMDLPIEPMRMTNMRREIGFADNQSFLQKSNVIIFTKACQVFRLVGMIITEKLL